MLMKELNSKKKIIWTPPQSEILQRDDILERVYFGGEGSGKSKWLIWQTIKYNIEMPGNNWLYCRETYPELEGTTIPDFFRELPASWVINYNQKDHKLLLKTSGKPSTILFKALDQVKKFKSFNLGGVSIDQIEEVPLEIILRLKGRLRLGFCLECGCQVSYNEKANSYNCPNCGIRNLEQLNKRYMLGAGNPAANWSKVRYYDTAKTIKTLSDTASSSMVELPYTDQETKEKKVHKVFVINTGTKDNPHNPKDYIQGLYASYPEAWVKRLVHGSWQGFEGAALTELKKDRHFIEPKSIENCRVWGAYDYGLRNPFSFLIFAKSQDDEIFIVNEAYAKGMGDTQQLLMMREACEQSNIDMDKLRIYGDPKIWSRTRTDQKSVYQDLQDVWARINPTGPLQLIPGTNNEAAGILLINRLFKENRLFVFDKYCPNTVRELPLIQWKKQSLKSMQEVNPREEIVDKDNHTFDCCKYGLNNSEVTQIIEEESQECSYEEFADMSPMDPRYTKLEDKFEGRQKVNNTGLDPMTGWRYTNG